MRSALVFIVLIVITGISFGQTMKESIDDIRKKYVIVTNEKESGKLLENSFEIACEYPTSGAISYYSRGTDLRLISHFIEWDDHWNETVEYFVWNDSLFFFFKDESGWEFDTENVEEDGVANTIDHIIQKRYYFVDNQPIRCLQKEYDLKSIDEMPVEPSQIANKTVACAETEQILSNFKRLMDLRNTNADSITCFWE